MKRIDQRQKNICILIFCKIHLQGRLKINFTGSHFIKGDTCAFSRYVKSYQNKPNLQKKVVGLDVSVDDADAVESLNNVQHLDGVVQGYGLDDAGFEGSTLRKFYFSLVCLFKSAD